MRAKIANAGYRIVLRSFFSHSYDLKTVRRNFDFIAGRSAKRVMQQYPDIKITEGTVGQVAVENIMSEGSERTILYIHGGGFVMGSIQAYRLNAARIARWCRGTVVLPDYRLAPEHRFPVALDDCFFVYKQLLDRVPPEKLIVAGDSAGGGLALALVLKVRDEKLSLPRSVFCFSPWADLTVSQPSWSKHKDEIWLNTAQSRRLAGEYAGAADLKNPALSPLFGDFAGFPPTLIFAGECEALFDDGAGVVDKITAAGGQAELFVGQRMQHVWPLFLPFLPESRRAMERLAKFVT